MTEGRSTGAATPPAESRREVYLRHLESTRLGRRLVAGGQMQAEHLDAALAQQKVTGERLGTVLLRQGYVTEGQLAQALAARMEVRTAYEGQAFEVVARQIVGEAAASEDAVADAEELRRSYLEQTRLGELLWQTGMVTREQLQEALRRQKETGKKIGEMLVWMGAISDHAVKIALGIQERLRALATAVGVCALMALATGCNSFDYRGTPVSSTPWDSQWESVRNAVKEAGSISYRPEAGGEHWQAPGETAMLGMGDCEDISIWLYSRLVQQNVQGARLCIGKRRPGDQTFHAWVVWATPQTTYILDPTTSPDLSKARTWPAGYYEPFYSYDLKGKYRHRTL